MSNILHRVKESLVDIKRTGGFFYRIGLEYLKKGWLRRNSRYTRYYEHMRIKEHVILYESFFGRGMLCGPYALYMQLINDPEYKEYKHIWVLDDLKKHERLLEQYKESKTTKFVEYLSRDYLKYLASAKYVINNVTFPAFYVKKEGQVYINTWHGIPLKKLGYDMPGGAMAIGNIVRNFLQTDYLISANQFLTDIYLKSHKLDGIYNGTIIEEGYPRLDILVNSSKAETLEKLEEIGVKVDPQKKILLYAPTWKEKKASVTETLEEYARFKACVEKAQPEYQVLVKVHQFVYAMIRDSQATQKLDYIIPATIDANEVLPLADILVSDYSSIFFDYLYFERPILFYIPDLEDYADYRGLYAPVDELPGPFSQNLEDIIEWIQNIDIVKQQYIDLIKRQKEKCCSYDVGHISERIWKIIMKGETKHYKVLQAFKTDKKKILIHRGEMLVNGISSALINLLKQIDYTKYDVSIVLTKPKNASEEQLIRQIPSQVRILVRDAGCTITYLENVRQNLSRTHGGKWYWEKITPKAEFKREAKRCFGDAHFDYAIEYEGYNLVYSLTVAAVPNATHCIWLHSDMLSEHELKFPWLRSIFSCYPHFDKIVSCSEAIMEVNREKLSTSETWKRFTYAKNAIDVDRVRAMSKQWEKFSWQGRLSLLFWDNNKAKKRTGQIVPLTPLPAVKVEVNGKEWITTDYGRNKPFDSERIALKQFDASGDNDNLLRFVAIGRLSPEKNYSNLIEAFHQFLQKGYNAMLYILGDGPSREELLAQVEELEENNRIIMTGNLKNPYALLGVGDCFMLTSLHEGQPVVINEARILHKPIIMTHFSAAKGSMIPNGQYMIDSSVEGILDGLVAFVQGEVPCAYEFDADEYNKEAVTEFMTAIGEQNLQ